MLSAQTPVLLKPCHMAEFPQRRIDDCKIRPEQTLAVQTCGHSREVRAGVAQIADKRGRIAIGMRVLDR